MGCGRPVPAGENSQCPSHRTWGQNPLEFKPGKVLGVLPQIFFLSASMAPTSNPGNSVVGSEERLGTPNSTWTKFPAPLTPNTGSKILWNFNHERLYVFKPKYLNPNIPSASMTPTPNPAPYPCPSSLLTPLSLDELNFPLAGKAEVLRLHFPCPANPICLPCCSRKPFKDSQQRVREIHLPARGSQEGNFDFPVISG